MSSFVGIGRERRLIAIMGRRVARLGLVARFWRWITRLVARGGWIARLVAGRLVARLVTRLVARLFGLRHVVIRVFERGLGFGGGSRVAAVSIA